MKNTQTGPKVKALYIAAIDDYAAKKEGILAKYLEANAKIEKSARKSFETAYSASDSNKADAALKSL